MVMLFVRGKPVGTLEQNTDVLRQLVEAGETVEFRTEAGRGLGKFLPNTPICPWEPDLTTEDIERRASRRDRHTQNRAVIFTRTGGLIANTYNDILLSAVT